MSYERDGKGERKFNLYTDDSVLDHDRDESEVNCGREREDETVGRRIAQLGKGTGPWQVMGSGE